MLHTLTKKLQESNNMVSLALFSLLVFTVSWTQCNAIQEAFSHCMSTQYNASSYLHAPGSSSYSNLLQSAQQNPRWANSTSVKPLFIVTPHTESEIQAAIVCSKRCNLQIRIISGGHDYEGLSYICKTPFVMIDLINFRSISISLEDETAWIQSGATLGELYYSIAKMSKIQAFPAGLCPSVGVGGHFSGGGLGTMLRKHGLAADNVIDACLIDVNGRILDREMMGEDLFWAIRGGGGGSFGVTVAWKVKLVRVPTNVTVFTIHKKLDREGIELVHRWQYIANNLHEDLFIRVIIQNLDRQSRGEAKTVEAVFNSLFLGPREKLLPLMKDTFPELGLQEEDCIEVSWIESVHYFAGYQRGQPLEVLLDRTVQYKSDFKAKSDFVAKPVPRRALERIREMFLGEQIAFMIMDPFGGRMDEIAESELPFPHRKGNLYNIQYLVKWDVDGKKHIRWIRTLYKYMEPYVSHTPRAAYINYRDLDLGKNMHSKTSYSHAQIWGEKYFKDNFERLARVKSNVDPENFFRHEQSIPLITD